MQIDLCDLYGVLKARIRVSCQSQAKDIFEILKICDVEVMYRKLQEAIIFP